MKFNDNPSISLSFIFGDFVFDLNSYELIEFMLKEIQLGESLK